MWQLLHFALGVGLLNLQLLLAAYGLLLVGLVFRLAVPRVEGAIFDAFNALEMSTFRWNLFVAVGLVLADVVFSFRCGLWVLVHKGGWCMCMWVLV